jgi:purine-binding chemotaxis protein CheW
MNAIANTDKKKVVEQKQFLTFTLGGEMFAISILCIKEIIWYSQLTEVPMMPACIRGVINLRGFVLPVMDLSTRFGKPSTVVTKSTCIIIVEIDSHDEQGQSQNIGVVVDAVQEVLEIASKDIEAAPSFGAKIRSDFIAGIGKVNGKFVILLNVNSVLSAEEISDMGHAAVSGDHFAVAL